MESLLFAQDKSQYKIVNVFGNLHSSVGFLINLFGGFWFYLLDSATLYP